MTASASRRYLIWATWALGRPARRLGILVWRLNKIGDRSRIEGIANIPDAQPTVEPGDKSEPAVIGRIDLQIRVVRPEARSPVAEISRELGNEGRGARSSARLGDPAQRHAAAGAHHRASERCRRLDRLCRSLRASTYRAGGGQAGAARRGARGRHQSRLGPHGRCVARHQLPSPRERGAVARQRRQLRRRTRRRRNVHHKHPMASIWDDGTTASSDGQYFRAGGRAGAGGAINAISLSRQRRFAQCSCSELRLAVA